MTKKRKHRGPPHRGGRQRAGGASKNGTSVVVHLLEEGTIESLRAAKEASRKLVDYHWNLYSELALQRSKIEAELTRALNEAAVENFSFNKWQRAVRYRYSLHPLCVLGSLKDPGGRFNIADIDPARFPQFPGLYLASDKDTALQETLGQVPPSASSRLFAQDIALMNPQSETIVSVSGKLDGTIDLREPKRLKTFVDLMKDFTLSADLKKMAKDLGIPAPRVLQTPSELIDTLLEADWRRYPMGSDVPANPQIFGHLVFLAGVDGIVYPSKLTSKDCLVCFPRNLTNTSSFVEMDDPTPDNRVPSKLDSQSWKLSEMSFEEITK